ncbi:MAG: GAF domain-containing protein [Anaerolineae bacterium]|nr:GAF domain-containing protein [Anaerolineae bacterium]
MIVVVGLIGLVTYSSSELVNETVQDQFRSQELQFTSSLAVQTETYFNGLNADITSLALEPSIKSIFVTERDASFVLLANHAAVYPDIVRTIVRYDYQGDVRYAWSAATNAPLPNDEVLPFNIPADLVRQTEVKGIVALDVEFRTASHRQLGDTFLLVAPVYTNMTRTEFILYELDIDALFNQILEVVELDERGQLWIIDALHEVMYQANETVEIDALYEEIPPAAMLSFADPIDFDYTSGGQERLAVVAPVSLRGEKFVLILSRDVADALDRVEADLQRIFVFAVGAIVMIAVFALAMMRGLAREAQQRQYEQQRRETARMLLEISRALNSTLDLEDVLHSIMAELSNIVPYDSAAVLLLDRSKLTLAAHRGTDADEHQAATFDLDQAHAANQVLQTGHPLVIDDTHTDKRWGALNENSKIRSWMGIPLRVREKTVGVLNINNHPIGRYKVEEIALVGAFA